MSQATGIEVADHVAASSLPRNINSWTADEQKKLEELLLIYPPETVDSHRFVKISKALGTRTPKQVASRVQKFFKKLHDFNLPGSFSHKPVNRTASGKNKVNKFRPSTFFPRNVQGELVVSDDDMDSLDNQFNKKEDDKRDKTLSLLKAVRNTKASICLTLNEPCSHKCGSCKEGLHVGSRWRCNDCPNDVFHCSDCLIFKLINDDYQHLNHNVKVS